MKINSISLPTAYMIETLRSHGISDEAILQQVGERDVTPWERLTERFDFNHLVELANEDQEQFKSILQDGYTVKFVTIHGLKNLLQMTFDKIPERDFQLTEKGISGLHLEEHELAKFEQVLSQNWNIRETVPQDKTFSIELD